MTSMSFGDNLFSFILVNVIDKTSLRLFGWWHETTVTAALALANHLHAFLAGGDAVTVAFEHFLGNPAHDFIRALRSFFELL